MIELRNNRLHVQIDTPGQSYHGSRFDWSAFITQVTLDQTHTFCTSESLKPDEGSGGVGLCNEFGIFRPIGYDDAREGEQFPKLGVGLLTRPAGPHNFFAPHPIEPFSLHFEHDEQSASFFFDALPCRGYAARLTKQVQLDENCLRINYDLENVGEKLISTHEYVHNFLSINGQPVGPKLKLEVVEAFHLDTSEDVSVLAQNGREVRWESFFEEAIMVRFKKDASAKTANKVRWKLSDAMGTSVLERGDFEVEGLSLWCMPHVCSPEVFVTIHLEAGEKMQWEREYEFAGAST